MRLSVSIENKFCFYALDDALVIVLYALDDFLDCHEELFVQKTVEKLICFYLFGISHLKLLRRHYYVEWIGLLVVYRVVISSAQSYEFIAFALYNMIFPHRINSKRLI